MGVFMAEQFIEEVMNEAKLNYMYKRCLEACYTRDKYSFSQIWNRTTAPMESVMNNWATVDTAKVVSYNNSVRRAAAAVDNPMICASIIEDEILPQIAEYLSMIATIDVTEGKWRLVSSKCGFLNLQNELTKEYVHSLSDPMWEAWKMAGRVYEPDQTSLVLMGAGLGYLPYQIFMKSERSIDIHLFENDPIVVEYAKNYGVLDWIPEDKLHIHINEDSEALLNDFINFDIDYKGSRFLISDWMLSEFEPEVRSRAAAFINNQKMLDCYRSRYEINFIHNENVFAGEIEELKNQNNTEEYIVVAGGPSLNDNIDFLKESVGKRTIIAVDAALKKLLNAGIKPDYVTIIDPNPNVMHYLDGIEEETYDIPLIAENVSYWEYVNNYKGKVYRVIATDNKWSIMAAERLNIEPWKGYGTVSNLALQEAILFGAKKIYFIGLDLSYPGGKHHADGIGIDTSNTIKGELQTRSVDGGMVDTTSTFMEFKEGIETVISKNLDIEYINLSKHGAYINGTMSGKWWEKLPTDDISEYVDKLSLETMLLPEEKYHLLWQIYNRTTSQKNNLEKLNTALKSLVDENIEQYNISTPCKTRSKMVFLVTTSFGMNNDKDKEILEDAYTIITSARKNVMIVNTDEYLGGKEVGVLGGVTKQDNDEWRDKEEISYKGLKIPYYQFDQGMPDTNVINEFISLMLNIGPERIISYDILSLLAEVCSRVITVKNK